MAADTSLPTRQWNVIIDIKLNRSIDDEIYVTHGCSIYETTILNGKSVTYKGFIRNENVNGNICLLTLNLVEQTTNELGQVCCRIKGCAVFKVVKLFGKVGINAPYKFTELLVTNHCLDDEVIEYAFLRDSKMKAIDRLSGEITFKQYDVTDIPREFATNDQIYNQYIVPWETTSIEKLAPCGYSIPEIAGYHVQKFRFVSGTALPFSYALFWTDRYFDRFEDDNVKCSQFVSLLYQLLVASVTFHPEFSGVDDFVGKCKAMLSSDTIDHVNLPIIDVAINILNTKTSSEPYITDEVNMSKLKRKVNVDQMSNICEICGCDCEDGAKYAYELKRLICKSDWKKILGTLSGDVKARIIYDTVFRLLNMTTAFFSVMFCVADSDLCHVVTVLVDNDTTNALVGSDVSVPKPIPLIGALKVLFVETTAYTSPFQSPYLTDAHKNRSKKQRHIENCISSSMKSTTVDTYASRETSNESISPFYRIFLNMITTEIGGPIDYLPIKAPGYVGFTLDDIHNNLRDLKLVPRIRPEPALHASMLDLINNQLPSYLIIPRDLEALYDIYGQKTVEMIEKEVSMCVKRNKTLKARYTPTKAVSNYVRVNIYTIDVVMKRHVTITEIMAKVEQTLTLYPFLVGFDYRIKQIYDLSTQTVVFNIFFYYDTKSHKIYITCERERHTQLGRFA